MVGNIREALSRIKGRFVARLQERFGDNGTVEKLDFHQYRHSVEVAENARKSLELIREADSDIVSDLDIILVEIEGLGHDLVQNSTKEKGKLRQRHRGMAIREISPELMAKLSEETARGLTPGQEEPGALEALYELSNFADGNLTFPVDGLTLGNEGASALETLYEMSRYKLPDGTPVFPVADKSFRKSVIDDFAVTLPEISYEELPDGTKTKALKVSEPYLTKDSSLRAFALASADLRGSVGAASDPSAFIENGNNELRELYHDIGQEIEGGIENISPDRRAWIADKIILAWQKDQSGFGRWQKILFSESVDKNKIINGSVKEAEIKTKLHGFYKPENFDRSIAAAQKKYEELEERFGSPDSEERKKKMENLSADDFRFLLREVGYNL